MATIRTVDVQEFINSHKLSPYQLLIVALCFLTVAFDGFDTASAGFIAPAIRKQWALNALQLAPVFGGGLFGLMVGALLFGPLADRFGRKPILCFSVAFFGVMCLWSAYATSLRELILLRFLTGLGLGGAMPTAITMTSEFGPEKQRSLLVTSMFCGFTLGGSLGGVVASQIIPLHGWQGVLLFGGAMPLVLVPVLLWLLPESVRYLALSGRKQEQVARTLRRIAPQEVLEHTVFTVPENKVTGSPVRNLFGSGVMVGTVCLWLTFFMSLLVYYLLTSWLPTVINNTGVPLDMTALIAAALPLGSTVGAVLIGRLMDRHNPCLILTSFYLVAAVFILLIGVASSLPMLVFAVFGAGLGTGGSQTGANALAAAYYPTSSRVSGVSWALGIGRVGSIVGSMVGGVLLAMHLGLPIMFVLVAIPTFVAALSMFGMGRHEAALRSSEVARTLPGSVKP
ncbi:MFS transporter [Paraburkholderia hospita]|jgi:AAHS family 4-hydroxybenzoate transporter-like MFS transporter|uniref:4-hydroxybenzoate transporter n=1 Tax=Paraburkholderia hospita TaxID=169430 RepID=A0AAN1MNT1_9BURK|nr:aromatic acid/H+ symport family MFS transporter [Paraburkholderia hospita]SKC99614.1 MFS transporter, AAHS family, 4-hydroxybenzoate transporter [Burkholderia sp. CF099]AUT73809.1 MFS transporter [Paraburkholderia hospita]EIM93969.1 4-hydroxybenzoate transporter [Paraburkholderia hospita]OUL83141.1 MFS transporter [Paraburkholderia hospita]OUL83550.1 MFS transporter [Paraburkholderia hospita]